MKLKGGFQSIDISTADLTASTLKVDGLSKACAGANDKPVRIKMPGGVEYYGSLKPTQSGFDISFLGADSKVSTISVDDTDDTFTIVTGGETSTGESDYKLGTNVDLRPYNSADNKYILPNDGIVSIRVLNGKTLTDRVKISLYFAGEVGWWQIVDVPSGTTGSFVASAFLKKGSRVYATAGVSDTSTVVRILYSPYVEV